MELRLEHMFLPYYGTIIIAGVIAALIMPRIPPLSRKSNNFYEHAVPHKDEQLPKGASLFKWGMNKAADRAKNTSFKEAFSNGTQNVLSMWLEVVPVVMTIGTIATIIATFTPVFSWLGAPFIPVLNMLQIPEATVAAQTVVVGFADMF